MHLLDILGLAALASHGCLIDRVTGGLRRAVVFFHEQDLKYLRCHVFETLEFSRWSHLIPERLKNMASRVMAESAVVCCYWDMDFRWNQFVVPDLAVLDFVQLNCSSVYLSCRPCLRAGGRAVCLQVDFAIKTLPEVTGPEYTNIKYSTHVFFVLWNLINVYTANKGCF